MHLLNEILPMFAIGQCAKSRLDLLIDSKQMKIKTATKTQKATRLMCKSLSLLICSSYVFSPHQSLKTLAESIETKKKNHSMDQNESETFNAYTNR